MVDFLSRMDNNDECTPVEDTFPDEHLFAVSTKPPLYANISNYLATGKVPPHLSYMEHRKIIHHSAQYSWMAGYYFHTGENKQIQCCVSKDDIYEVLKATHDGPCGANFVDKRTGHKVLQTGY